MTIRLIRSAAPIVFSLALTGCIFLVDSLPDGTSTTCQLTTPPYSSGTNACKTCITSNCQKDLDACCSDSSCQAQLSNVDSCANQDGCSALAGAGGTEGATSDLISCIANACGADCSGIDAGPDGSSTSCSSCKTNCATSSAYEECSCVPPTSTQPANAVTCDSESYSNSICCASSGWPTVAGGSCACETLFCDDENGVCNCQIGVSVVGGTNVFSCYPSGSSSSCCLSADKTVCTCDPNDACDQVGETTVDNCSTSTMPCPSGGSRPSPVTSCSR